MCSSFSYVVETDGADKYTQYSMLWCRYLEVIWKEQFAGPEETENVAEYLAVPIYEVVLLQAVQHDGLGAIEQTTDSEN